MLTRRRFLALSAVLASPRVLAVPVPAAPPGNPVLEVRTEVPSASYATILETRYRNMGRYLSATFGTLYQVWVQSGRQVDDRPLNSLLIAPPLVIRNAMEGAFTPVAQTSFKEKIIIVAATGSRWARIKDYRGQRLGLPPQGTQSELMARMALRSGMVHKPEAYFSLIRYATAEENLLKSLRAGIVDVVAIPEKLVAPGEPDLAKLLSSPAYPMLAIAMRNRPGNPPFDQMRKALFLPSDDGRRALEATGITPLDPVDPILFPPA